VFFDVKKSSERLCGRIFQMGPSIPLVSGIGNFLGGAGDIVTRDAGHALNAGNNLLAGYGLHAPATAPAGGYAPGTGPNSLGTQLVNGAHADPNNPGTIVNFAGMGQPVSSFTPTPSNIQASQNSAPTGQQTPGQTNNVTTNNTPGTGSGWSAYNNAYNTVTGGLQDQLSSIPSYRDADVAAYNGLYNAGQSGLEAQHQTGLTNLGIGQTQLDTQRTQGIRNLGNSLRTALNGYQNQIGVMGAGNSSAAPLIGYALSQQGNREMGDLNNQYNTQQTGINSQGASLEANFNAQKQMLDAQRNQALEQIATRYSAQQDALQQAMKQAGAQQAQYLAIYGQTALANQAVQDLQALDQKYNNSVTDLHQSLMGAAQQPAPDISQYTGLPNVTPFTQQQLQPLTLQANQDTTNNAFAAPSLMRRPDQTTAQSNFGF
jgi:hypothetical protein